MSCSSPDQLYFQAILTAILNNIKAQIMMLEVLCRFTLLFIVMLNECGFAG